MKFVLFNGPKRCGKDTYAKTFAGMARMYDFKPEVMWFARALKETAHHMAGLHEIPWDYFESCKDKPQKELFGHTPRQWYIKVSEEIVKPVMGKDYWGKVTLNSVKKIDQAQDPYLGRNLILFADSGFVDEAQPLIEHYGANNFLLVRLSRQGASFDGDSRSYWYDPRILTWEIENNTPMNKIHKVLETTVLPWVKEEIISHELSSPERVSGRSPHLRLVSSTDPQGSSSS